MDNKNNRLYESIMRNVQKGLKKTLSEARALHPVLGSVARERNAQIARQQARRCSVESIEDIIDKMKACLRNVEMSRDMGDYGEVKRMLKGFRNGCLSDAELSKLPD